MCLCFVISCFEESSFFERALGDSHHLIQFFTQFKKSLINFKLEAVVLSTHRKDFNCMEIRISTAESWEILSRKKGLSLVPYHRPVKIVKKNETPTKSGETAVFQQEK